MDENTMTRRNGRWVRYEYFTDRLEALTRAANNPHQVVVCYNSAYGHYYIVAPTDDYTRAYPIIYRNH